VPATVATSGSPRITRFPNSTRREFPVQVAGAAVAAASLPAAQGKRGLLEEVSRKSGMQIVACTGHWLSPSLSMAARTADELARSEEDSNRVTLRRSNLVTYRDGEHMRSIEIRDEHGCRQGNPGRRTCYDVLSGDHHAIGRQKAGANHLDLSLGLIPGSLAPANRDRHPPKRPRRYSRRASEVSSAESGSCTAQEVWLLEGRRSR
jgi:hypothetical protein